MKEEHVNVIKGILDSFDAADGDIARIDFGKEAAARFRAALKAAVASATEADELIRALGFDPERFRTECGFINHSRLRAAIRHPENYAGLMLPTTPNDHFEAGFPLAAEEAARAARQRRPKG